MSILCLEVNDHHQTHTTLCASVYSRLYSWSLPNLSWNQMLHLFTSKPFSYIYIYIYTYIRTCLISCFETYVRNFHMAWPSNWVLILHPTWSRVIAMMSPTISICLLRVSLCCIWITRKYYFVFSRGVWHLEGYGCIHGRPWNCRECDNTTQNGIDVLLSDMCQLCTMCIFAIALWHRGKDTLNAPHPDSLEVDDLIHLSELQRNQLWRGHPTNVRELN